MMKLLGRILASLFFTSLASGATIVKVGAYLFVPYYKFENNGHYGLTARTVHLLNSMQSEYKFEIQQMPPNQRYQSFVRKRVDLFLFEDPSWEWTKYSYQFIPLDVDDGEVYITRVGIKTPPRSFEELKKMKLAVVKGYHYSFAGLNTDERFLKRNFQVEIVENSDACLNLLISGKADVTLVAKSFIYEYLRRYPELKEKISVSDNFDSIWKLGVVFNPAGKISREKLETLIGTLKKNDDFRKMLESRFEK